MKNLMILLMIAVLSLVVGCKGVEKSATIVPRGVEKGLSVDQSITAQEQQYENMLAEKMINRADYEKAVSILKSGQKQVDKAKKKIKKVKGKVNVVDKTVQKKMVQLNALLK